MPDIWLITGIPGAGKTIAARLLAGRFQRGVHIEGDLFLDHAVSGGVRPGDEPIAESERQLRLTWRNQCLLARSYVEAGFDVVIDYVISSRSTLQEFRSQLTSLVLHLVVLTPGKETAIERDLHREKSQSFKEELGIGLAEYWSFIEDEMTAELGGTGFWIGNAKLRPRRQWTSSSPTVSVPGWHRD